MSTPTFKVRFRNRNFSFAHSEEEARKMIVAAAKTCGVTLREMSGYFFFGPNFFARVEAVDNNG